MNIVNGAGPPGPHFVKKLEPTEDRGGGGGGKDIKPVRTTLNRVPRSSEVVSTFDIFTDFKPVSSPGACVSFPPLAFTKACL
jgi:hypothetical protein